MGTSLTRASAGEARYGVVHSSHSAAYHTNVRIVLSYVIAHGRPPSQRRPAAQNPASQEQSMRKQNRDDDPAVHSFPPPAKTPENILYTPTKTLSSATGQLVVGRVAPTPKHPLARRLCLLVDWLHPPRNSLSSQSAHRCPPLSATPIPIPRRQPTPNAAEVARDPPNQAQYP